MTFSFDVGTTTTPRELLILLILCEHGGVMNRLLCEGMCDDAILEFGSVHEAINGVKARMRLARGATQ